MQPWDETSDQVTKITPDKEKAKALLTLIELREKDLATKKEEFATLIIEGYYEIIKEAITALMSIDGYKTVSHELLIGYLAQFYKQCSTAEIYFMDQLRKTRNEIAYRGAMIPQGYITTHKEKILTIIAKLKKAVNNKLEGKS